MLFDKTQRFVGLLATLPIPYMAKVAAMDSLLRPVVTPAAPVEDYVDLFAKATFSANTNNVTDAKPIPIWEGGWQAYSGVATNITKYANKNECYSVINHNTGDSTEPPGMELTFYNGPAYPGHGTTCEANFTQAELVAKIANCAGEMHKQNVVAGCCIIALLFPGPNRTVTQHDIWSQHVKLSTSPHKYPSDAIECQGWQEFLAHP